MKRTLTITAKILIFLIGFIFAVYHFADWRSIGKFAVSMAHSRLERNGMRMGYSDVSGEEDGFTIDNLTLNGAANVSFGSITIRPRIIPSILSMSAVCDINFRNCSVRLGQSMNFGDGRVLLTAGRNEILLTLLPNCIRSETCANTEATSILPFERPVLAFGASALYSSPSIKSVRHRPCCVFKFA